MWKIKIKNKQFGDFKIKNQSDKTKVLINLFLYYGLRIFVLSYGMIRIFLINIYLGVSNFGLLNIMMLIAPMSLFLISAFQAKSNYILYKYSLVDDYKSLNIIINEQIKQMRVSTYISLFFLGGLMVLSYFLVNSPGLSHLTACLLIFVNSIGILSLGIVLPYVQWYLNSLNLNYIYDSWEIIFSTIFNIISFILIILFGLHTIVFRNTTYEQGSTYIILIVTFLLTLRLILANIVLNFQKKKYMPWFKKIKVGKIVYFSKNNRGYIFQQFLGSFATLFIPITFFILTTFVRLTTMLSGIYYSYTTFVLIITLLGWCIAAIKPYLAKRMINSNAGDIYQLNKLLSALFIFIGSLLLIDFIIISPYIMIFSKSYFSFWFAFLIGMLSLLLIIKSVDEAFIYLDGRPEKYWKLTIYEIIIGLIAIIISLIVVFMVHAYAKNALNLLYAIMFSELIMRFSKYIINIIYLNKVVYHVSFVKFIRDYWSIYLYWVIVVLFIICFLSINQYLISLQAKYTNNNVLAIFDNGSIDLIINDNIHLINYGDVFLALILINFGFITSLVVYIKWFNPKVWNLIKDVSKSSKIRFEQKILWRKF